MYEEFGAREIGDTGQVAFKLFVPDDKLNPSQYEGGGLPRIRHIHVVGDFQSAMGGVNWIASDDTFMHKDRYIDAAGTVKGWLYSVQTPPLPEGFYQYKFYVTYENAPARHIGDPCTRYGGAQDQNSGIAVGGRKIREVESHPKRVPYKDLVIYEVMLDDFTHGYLNGRAPLDAFKDKLPYLAELGINAIEFMPLMGWNNNDFSWGYNPVQYFSVSHRYTLDAQNPADKLFYLKELVNECHRLGINLIMDAVFNHAESEPPHRGFPYYWLYQDPADSPYVGNFAEHAYFKDIDYANRCSLEFILDACKYWMDVFKFDGIRFDNTLGFYKADDRGHGLSKLLAELRGHLSERQSRDFGMILEHEWDYPSVAVTNNVGATSCWLDPYRARSQEYLGRRQIDDRIMRMLNSGRDFAPGRCATVYIENHDHECIALKGPRSEWWRTQPYAIALFTSPGAVMIHNGQEFGDDYWMPEQGSGRVQPRPLHWDYLNDDIGKQLLGLYKKLIRMRKDHPGLRSPNFHPPTWDDGRQTLKDGFGVDVARQVVVYHRWGQTDDGRLERFYIVLNFSDSTQHVELELPEQDGWVDLLSGWQPQLQNKWLRFDVGRHWGHVLCRQD